MNGIRSKFWALIGILCIATAAYTVSLTVPQSMTVRESASAERASAQGAPKAITTASAISSKPSASVANAVRPLFAAPVWGKAVLPPLLPSSSKASREILATGTIKASAFTAFKDLRKGQHVVLPFGEHDIDGVINLVKLGAEQDEIAGVFADGTRGSFFLSQMGPNRDQLAGQVLLVGEGVGYEILPTDHGLVVNKKPIQSLFCMGMPPAPHPVAQAAASTSPQAITVPVLDSLPGSRGVLYLDFDGEVVTDGSWNGGVTIFASAAVVNGLPISAAQITDIWRRVSEDFKPFNVSVTTDESRYASAPIGERMRCIITPTNSWYSNAGGVAYVGSYRGPYVGYSVDIPCWVFNTYNTSDIALAASHELGHTLGLSHDGATLSSGHEEYYPGHDTFFPASWGAIMGAPYDIVVTQWSKGEYPFANNFEDDLKVMADTIAKGGFVVGTIPDDVGNSIATAGSFGVSGTINQPGTISTNTDGDYYEFKTKGGSVTINAVVDTPDPDLDSQLILYDSAGNTVATSAINANLASSITTTLVSGQFFVQITNKGRAAAPADPPTSTPARIGYSTYGSMGSYTLTGSFLPLPSSPSSRLRQQVLLLTRAPKTR